MANQNGDLGQLKVIKSWVEEVVFYILFGEKKPCLMEYSDWKARVTNCWSTSSTCSSTVAGTSLCWSCLGRISLPTSRCGLGKLRQRLCSGR